MANKKSKKFKKRVKYFFPDGDEFNGTFLEFWSLGILFYISYIITSPIHYFWSNFIGKRKVYWEEIK